MRLNQTVEKLWPTHRKEEDLSAWNLMDIF